MARKLALLTTGRQDWGILRSTALRLREDPRFELCLLAGGMHCSTAFGRTVEQLRADGFAPHEEMAWIPESGSLDASLQSAAALAMVSEALGRHAPEALILLGDRFETAAAALAATLCGVPLVHLHGGEETEGAFDNNLRHAITKMSHLHLVSHEEHRARVVHMGEDPATVHVVGAPGLDNLHRADLPGRAELEASLGLTLTPPVVLVTLHPATAGGDAAQEAEAVAGALDMVDATYVITLPNTDPGQAAIRARLAQATTGRARRVAVDALGDRRYWGMLRLADAVLGNSSSALIEAPAVSLPAVNVGERQRGRKRGGNVIDSAPSATAIAAALARALAPKFREQVRREPSPFGDGHAAERIVELLAGWAPPRPPVKRAVAA